MKPIIALAVLLLLCSTALAQTDAENCTAKGGTLTDGMCVISQTTDTYEYAIDYPLELLAYDVAEPMIDAFVTQEQEVFLQTVEANEEFAPGPLTLDINYTLFPYGDDVIGVRFLIGEYLGGATSNSRVVTYTFDTEGNVQLTLEDLFRNGVTPLNTISTVVEQELQAQLGDALFEEGLEPVAANFENFILDEDENALVFTFNKYQVAPGAAGTPSASVSLFRVQNNLLPEYILFRKG